MVATRIRFLSSQEQHSRILVVSFRVYPKSEWDEQQMEDCIECLSELTSDDRRVLISFKNVRCLPDAVCDRLHQLKLERAREGNQIFFCDVCDDLITAFTQNGKALNRIVVIYKDLDEATKVLNHR